MNEVTSSVLPAPLADVLMERKSEWPQEIIQNLRSQTKFVDETMSPRSNYMSRERTLLRFIFIGQ
ncbi:hypothetical protein KIN20_020736 [Parelaphostrongylus tenuis]|uniref:Uncharacterized protein n=1 Tax=Parelaphostrongylus tenuis TaxID=148309 RepID=A0AAD5MRP9_PARTN|nr:hypothetical protein KIN20_020736 [Parelaphostrongylus tenuis]